MVVPREEEREECKDHLKNGKHKPSKINRKCYSTHQGNSMSSKYKY